MCSFAYKYPFLLPLTNPDNLFKKDNEYTCNKDIMILFASEITRIPVVLFDAH